MAIDMKIEGIDGEDYSYPTTASSATPLKIVGIDGKEYSIPTSGGGGGGTGTETDPIYTADKPNIALKSEVQDNMVIKVENEIQGTNALVTTLTRSNDTTVSSAPLILPGGGGASNYFEADLSGTTFPFTLDTSLTTIGDTSTPFTGNGNSDYSLNIQGTFSRVGGNAADDVVQLQIVTNGGYMKLIDVNFNVQRNTTKFPFSYHTKKYKFGGSPTYLKIAYTGSGTVTIDSLAFWVE